MQTELKSAYVFYQSDPSQGLMVLKKYVIGAWNVFSKYAGYVVKTEPVDDKTLLRFRDFGDHEGTITGKTQEGVSKEKLISIDHIWFRDSSLYEKVLPIILKKPDVKKVAYPAFGAINDGLIGEITILPEMNGVVPTNFHELYDIVEEFEENFWQLGQASPTNFLLLEELKL